MQNFDNSEIPEDMEEADLQNSFLVISNMEDYVLNIVEIVAKEIGEGTNPLEVFMYCSKQQIISLVYENCIGYNRKKEPVLNFQAYNNIFDLVLRRVQNCAIAKLAAEGYLDCAWDDELNDMVFWLSDNHQKKSAEDS
jgi:hypothetical protein